MVMLSLLSHCYSTHTLTYTHSHIHSHTLIAHIHSHTLIAHIHSHTLIHTHTNTCVDRVDTQGEHQFIECRLSNLTRLY